MSAPYSSTTGEDASVSDDLDSPAAQLGAHVALADENQIVRRVLWLTDLGCYDRQAGEWVPLDPTDTTDAVHSYDVTDIDPAAVSNVLPLWDSAAESHGTMTLTDFLS